MKAPILVTYGAIAAFGLLVGQIEPDLLSLGVRAEIISIASKAASVFVTAIGGIAIALGAVTKADLPEIPPKE